MAKNLASGREFSRSRYLTASFSFDTSSPNRVFFEFISTLSHRNFIMFRIHAEALDSFVFVWTCILWIFYGSFYISKMARIRPRVTE